MIFTGLLQNIVSTTKKFWIIDLIYRQSYTFSYRIKHGTIRLGKDFDSGKRVRERERQTDRQRERERERERDRQTDRERETDRHRERNTYTHIQRQRQIERKETNRKKRDK